MKTNFDYSSFFKKLEKLASNDHVNSTNEKNYEIFEAPSRLTILKEMENVKNNKKIVTEM